MSQKTHVVIVPVSETATLSAKVPRDNYVVAYPSSTRSTYRSKDLCFFSFSGQKDEQIENTYRFNPPSFSLHNKYDIVPAFKASTHTDSTSVAIAIQSNFSSYSLKPTTGVVSANIEREPVRRIAAPVHDTIGISRPPDSWYILYALQT